MIDTFLDSVVQVLVKAPHICAFCNGPLTICYDNAISKDTTITVAKIHNNYTQNCCQDTQPVAKTPQLFFYFGNKYIYSMYLWISDYNMQ